MAKGTRGGEAAIEKLLDERQRIEAWLARLGGVAENAPARVRNRVRADYEQRLVAVVEELTHHTEAVREALAEKQESRRRMGEDATALEDRLAEARLRHAVGEYTDQEWEKLQTDGEAELAAVRARLATVQEEIEKLTGVVQLIEQGERQPSVPAAEGGVPEPAEAPPAEAAPAPPTPRGPGVPASGLGLGAPPLPLPSPPPAQTEAFDELAFLKSVTEGADLGAVTGEPRGTPETERAEERTSSAKPGSPFRRFQSGQAEKTLRCADCGTMNLPTEWYCEQCGAELAAL